MVALIQPSEDGAALFAPSQLCTPICGGSDAESPTPFCAHCTQPLTSRTYCEIYGNRFHVKCLGELMSDSSIALPLTLNPRTRMLLEESRQRVRRARRGTV